MPEFPLSRPDLKQTEKPREYRGRSGMDFEGARHWRLVQVSRYANLQPSQIVREMDAPDRGWDPSPATGDEHAPRSERQDATADADRQRENTGLVTVDERRYVVDPIVDGHTFTGLWTGGPIQHYVAKDNHKYLRQTLTRTWCAGHGYTVAEDGAYIAEWPASFDETTGAPTSWTEDTPEGYGGVHGTSGNKDKEHSDAPPVREYRTAKDCLKACRPWMEGRLSPYMVFRTDIPSSYTREVYWREFTHESITPLERLGKDVEALREVVAYHFGSEVAGNVLDAHTRVDPQTNTVIFVCSLLYTELSEPKTPDELLELPVIDAPCTRDTLRMFGWNQLRNGEGYKYTHVFRWPRLKDTPTTRRTIEFIKDNAETLASSFLPKLLSKHYHPEIAEGGTKPDGWWAGYETVKPISLDSPAEKDNTGRLSTTVDTGTYIGGPTATPTVQHYRIAQQKVDVEQDGSLTFTIAISKAEWHGFDDGKDYENGGQRQLAGVSAPLGWAKAEERVIPSVPRDNAIATMNAIKVDDWEIVHRKSQSEGQEGSSDVSFQKRKVYDYISPPGTGHTPFVINVDGTNFNAPDYRYDPETNVYSLSFPQVKQGSVQALIDALRQKLGGDPKIHVQDNGDGSCTVSVTGHSIKPRHIKEWVVEADWFQHQTMEQWLGVATNITKGGTGPDAEVRGFYSEYTTNQQGQLVPVPESWIPLAAVRGDLDADWMGSQPQHPSSDNKGPILYYTIGIGDANKERREDIDHDDEHGDGWNAGKTAWIDPDDSGNSADKGRSHAITRVHPRINGDNTLDLSITRIYPHQRKWEWEFDQMNKSGDIRTIYHAVYRNWPSRQAIQDDIIKRFLTDHNEAVLTAQSEDGYTLSGSISVNQFGLVDAPGLTLTPNWENSRNKKARAKTYTAHLDQKVGTIEKTHTCPQSFRNQDGTFNHPADGFWWRVVTYYIYSGETTAKGEAWREYGRKGKIYEGSKGVEKANGKPDINALWKWHVVYNITTDSWRDSAIDYSQAQTEVISSGDGVAPD